MERFDRAVPVFGSDSSSAERSACNSVVGSLAKGFLWRVCGNSAENSQKFAKNTFYCVRKGCGHSAESCGNFMETCGNASAMTPSLKTP